MYVIDAVVPDDLSEPLPLLLDLHMHVVLGGRERTAAQHEELLAAAGLHLDRVIPTRSHAMVLQASAA